MIVFTRLLNYEIIYVYEPSHMRSIFCHLVRIHKRTGEEKRKKKEESEQRLK